MNSKEWLSKDGILATVSDMVGIGKVLLVKFLNNYFIDHFLFYFLLLCIYKVNPKSGMGIGRMFFRRFWFYFTTSSQNCLSYPYPCYTISILAVPQSINSLTHYWVLSFHSFIHSLTPYSLITQFLKTSSAWYSGIGNALQSTKMNPASTSALENVVDNDSFPHKNFKICC